jgi:RHS repeat-associated protein
LATRFLNARYYDSQRGQFLSEDPVFWEVGQSQDGRAVLTNPQAMNSYAYGNGNPISNKDQSGRASYLYAALAAYDATIVWDFGADVASNLRNPSLPWYQKQAGPVATRGCPVGANRAPNKSLPL